MTATGGPPAAAPRPPSDGPPDARAAIWALAGELEHRHHITRMYGRACPPAGAFRLPGRDRVVHRRAVAALARPGRDGELAGQRPAGRRGQTGAAGAVAPAGPGAGADLTAHGQAATGRRATRPARDQRAAAVRDRGHSQARAGDPARQPTRPAAVSARASADGREITAGQGGTCLVSDCRSGKPRVLAGTPAAVGRIASVEAALPGCCIGSAQNNLTEPRNVTGRDGLPLLAT